ncbi:MAG: hypothetical protein WD995_00195 [Gemmatimonadota bacterium]
MRAFPYSAATVVLATTLLVLAAQRWHEAAVALPDRIASVDEPSVVLLVQALDCPDRRASMIAWLDRIEAEDPTRAVPVLLGVLDEDSGSLGPTLDALPRLAPEDVSRAARAVMRSGISGTPAVILLDGEGRVLLTDTFATTGPAPRLALAATLLPRVQPPSASGRIHPFDGR